MVPFFNDFTTVVNVYLPWEGRIASKQAGGTIY